MLLSLNWLRDYLQKSDVKIDPHMLADKLTMLGLPVASIRKAAGLGLDNVVVGRIDKIDKHPNADRLQVTQVVVSNDGQPRQIVCGAKNIAVGDIVPVALPGAILPGNFEIKVSQIRQVESHGMLCSSKELGIAEDGEGILQLPKHSQLGELVAKLLGSSQEDTILEFELPPNRPDCLSVLGIAREIAPLLKTKIRDPKPARFRISAHRTSSIIKLEVDDAEACPRYVARVIDGIKVTESPDWIKQRLQSVGIRPINNIVDITNFVMMEYGQPLHAFDLRKLQSGTVRVAKAKQAGQTLELLNDQMVAIEPDDILILDGDRPIALAGIMGGKGTQIEADTTSILLESAAFLPQQIRRTAKRVGIASDAAKRFEKGVDLLAVALASERAASLLRDSFNANVYHPGIDTNEFAYQEQTLALDMREVRKLTGMRLASETVSDLLETVGIQSFRKSPNILSLKLPSYRLDLKHSIDLVEEVARLAGYENIVEKTPISAASYTKLDESAWEFERAVRESLVHMGLHETIHYSFTSEQLLGRYGYEREDAVHLKNPLSEEMKVLRTSLLPSLIETYIFNSNRGAQNQNYFEVARVYAKDDKEETKVKETPMVAGLLSGSAIPSNWRGQKWDTDFYHAKGVVEHMFRELTTVIPVFEPLKHHRLFHPNKSAVIKLGVREVGFVGEVHPFIRKKYLETTESVVVFELNLEALKKYIRSSIRYQGPSKFPSIELDLAFTVDKTATGNSMVETIKHVGSNLLHQVKIFDVYSGENVTAGKKSLAFRLTFSSPERTLQDTEVTSLKEKIVQAVSEKHQAQIRA